MANIQIKNGSTDVFPAPSPGIIDRIENLEDKAKTIPTKTSDLTNDSVIGAKFDGNYYGMTDINGADTAWIRTTTPGIIPHEYGNLGNGHSNIGTENYVFANGWFDNINGGKPVTSHGGTIGGVISSDSILSLNPTNIILVPEVPFALLDPTHESSIFFKEYLKWLCSNYPNHSKIIFFGAVTPNSAGIAMCYIYDTNDTNSEGLPQYSTGMYLPLGSGIQYFKTMGYAYSFVAT